MKVKKTTLYTLEELKKDYPDVYELAIEKYQQNMDADNYYWCDEVFEGFKRFIESTGIGKVKDYSLAYSQYGDQNDHIDIDIDAEKLIVWALSQDSVKPGHEIFSDSQGISCGDELSKVIGNIVQSIHEQCKDRRIRELIEYGESDLFYMQDIADGDSESGHTYADGDTVWTLEEINKACQVYTDIGNHADYHTDLEYAMINDRRKECEWIESEENIYDMCMDNNWHFTIDGEIDYD